MKKRILCTLPGIWFLVSSLAVSSLSAHETRGYEATAALGIFQLDDRGFAARPLTHDAFKGNSRDFQFAIVSDRTGGHRTPIFRQAIQRVNLLQPEFVVSVGDMIEGYTSDREELDNQWNEFNRMIDELDSPYFYTPGNHDFSNDVMAQIWQERYGADYYHMVYKDVLFLMLNTESGLAGVNNPELDNAQYAYAERVLNDNPEVRWTLVFLHQPLWKFKNTPNWDKLQDKLTARRYTAFAGHMHSYDYHLDESGQEQITLGSTGGVSLLRGSTYGEFDHVTWVTMTERGPLIANLALDGIHDKYITDPAFDELFDQAEVFDYGPWYEEGERLAAGHQYDYLIVASNPFPEPLDYQLSFESTAALHIKSGRIAGTLAPGESRSQLVPLSVIETVDREASQPLVFRASASYAINALKKADWEHVVHIKPVTRHKVSASAAPMRFDGKLDEWPALRFGFGASPGSNGNGVARFDVTFDEAHLYIAFDINDDEVTSTRPLGFDGSSDLAAIFIDARPSELSARQLGSTKGLKKGEWIFTAVAPNRDQGELAYADLMPEGFSGRTALREGGYSAEIRLPLSYMNRTYGSEWRDFRINVSVLDSDPGAKRVANHQWQPGWEKNVVGTGLFFRQ